MAEARPPELDSPTPELDPPTPEPARREPGWREVLLVAGVAVSAVFAAVVVTAILPPDLQRVVLQTPLLIVVLLVGTGALLWSLARRGSPPS